jgi:hypothetical protein
MSSWMTEVSLREQSWVIQRHRQQKGVATEPIEERQSFCDWRVHTPPREAINTAHRGMKILFLSHIIGTQFFLFFPVTSFTSPPLARLFLLFFFVSFSCVFMKALSSFQMDSISWIADDSKLHFEGKLHCHLPSSVKLNQYLISQLSSDSSSNSSLILHILELIQ